MAKNILEQDYMRYPKASDMPAFQKYFRKVQSTRFFPLKFFYNVIFRILKEIRCVEIPKTTQIGPGLYLGHAYNITINHRTIIGKNVNIHKGVTIGQTNRGERQGVPVIGNDVWIGINAIVVGKIIIGDDVMIAPNSYVNCDVPSHSIAIGNPCIIKHRENATEGYIDRRV